MVLSEGRRKFLAAGVATVSLGVAGCSYLEDDEENNDRDGGSAGGSGGLDGNNPSNNDGGNSDGDNTNSGSNGDDTNVGSGNDDDSAVGSRTEESDDNVEESQPTPTWQTVLDTREQVQEDMYQTWRWSPNTAVESKWEFTVRDGPDIEMFLMEPEEFEEYQAENRFYVMESESGIEGDNQFRIEAGEYRLVLDNTNAGELSPPTNLSDDVADVEITVEAKSI